MSISLPAFDVLMKLHNVPASYILNKPVQGKNIQYT